MDKGSIDGMKENFYKAVLLLENEDECKKFFDDICTIGEINSISQRLQVAIMLKDGITFNEIARATGASSATIARVNKCINYGEGGYNAVIEKIK